MSVSIVEFQKYRWVTFSKADEEAINYLRDNFRFHSLDFEDVKGESDHPKLDVYKHYFFLIAHFPVRVEDGRRVHSNELDVFIEENTIVTIPNERSPYLESLFQRLERNPKLREEWFTLGPSFFCYKLLKSLYYESFKPLRNHISAELRELDQEVFTGDDFEVVADLARVRRDVLDIKRILGPQRYVVRDLVALHAPFVSKDMSLYFDDLRDLLDRIWSFVENYESIVTSLADTNESLISLHTNRVLKVVAIISVAFLPMTLITGIYGMNLAALPFADHPGTVWGVFALIVVFMAGVFAVLKKIKWL